MKSDRGNLSLLYVYVSVRLRHTIKKICTDLTGENIQFYPDSTRLIGVDRNLRLPEYLTKGNRSWQFSHIIIERLIVGDGSCLREVPTGYVDAVVTTRSLCSVISLQSTLREIHRVLAPVKITNLFFQSDIDVSL